MRPKAPTEPKARSGVASLLKLLRAEQRMLSALLATQTLPADEQSAHYDILLCCDHRLEGVRMCLAMMRQA
jgi:hypothetical protein